MDHGDAHVVGTEIDDVDKMEMVPSTGYELSEVENSVLYGLCDDPVSGIAVGFKRCLRWLGGDAALDW